MPLQRRPIVTSLTVALAAALLSALAAAADVAPTYETLFQQASTAYAGSDSGRCVELFKAAARAASRDGQAARSYFAAAACATAGGDKDAAFALLKDAAAKGYRDVDRATSNPKLEPLRQDPRWTGFLDGVKSREAARHAGDNAEMTRICDEDQKDRQVEDPSKIDWTVVGKRDAERLQRTKEIAAQGGLKSADDYFHAALVLQHSSGTADFEQAHQWCLKGLELDPDLPAARWLAAATEDRYLMNQGKPQLYGTQFKKDKDGPWYLYQVDPSITDEERAKWDVPSLASAKAHVDQMNGGTPPPH
jgi:hypothetical protein